MRKGHFLAFKSYRTAYALIVAGTVMAAVLAGGALPAAAAANGCPEPAGTDPDRMGDRIMCLVNHGATIEALTYGEQMRARGLVSARLLSALGRAHEDAGHIEEALAYEEEAHRLDPTDPLIGYRLASMLADRVDELAPAARGENIPDSLAHCFTNDLSHAQARKRFERLARRADQLYAQAIAGLTRERGADDIVTLNARMERALLHVTLKGAKALPELNAVAAAFQRLAEKRGDPSLFDMASGVFMNLASSLAMEGNKDAARKVLNEAYALARSEDQKRVVEAAAHSLVGDPADAADLEAMISSSPDCTLSSLRPLNVDLSTGGRID